MTEYHSLKIEQCYRELKTSSSGLYPKEVLRRIDKYGKNELPKEKKVNKIGLFFNQVKNPLIYILLIAGVISLILRDYIDAGVIVGAVLINTVIGFIQESKANNALAKLKEMIKHRAVVIRGGQEMEVGSEDIVVGDIVLIKSGNRIPADGRIIEADSLMIDESALTGESIPAEKNIDVQPTGAVIGDRKNMAYAGTVVVKGLGKIIISKTGGETEIGQIAKMVKEAKEEKTPLQIKLSNFSSLLGIVIAGLSLGIAVIGIIQGRGIFEMFITGVALAVSAIPEGLIVAVTVILVLGMQRILKHNALVKKLVAAETLGSTTVICTDKTGTLTEGKMHVTHIVIGEKEFELNATGSRQDPKEAEIVSLTLQAAMMCNEAVIENPNDELAVWRIVGEPTEAALMSAAVQSGLNKKELLKVEPKIAVLPFDSANKYMLSLHKKKDSFVLYEKGAPEKLLSRASNFFHQGKKYPLSKDKLKKLKDLYEKLTSRGLRVIGVAIKEIKNLEEQGILLEENSLHLEEQDWEKINNDLTFLGFIALKDPLRAEAAETINICRQAGIRPVIITGDHPLTAKAIALELGIEIKRENIVSGEDLDKISDEKLKKIVGKIDIYARVNPHHKLRIVNALQAKGEVVAMTGDGVNDSPAIKTADIGISLGTGTDIAKETADIILLDNNFKTIVMAVHEGRVIFSNIRKVATYLLSDSFSEMIIITGSIIFGLPLAILPTQILWINIVNDGLPNFSLAFEKDDNNAMTKKPLKKNENFMNKEMKILIFGVGLVRDSLIFLLFVLLFTNGHDIDYLRSLFFVMLAVKSLFSIFSLRSFTKPIWKINPFSNHFLLIAATINIFLVIAAVYWRPLQIILSTTPLNRNGWIMVILVGILGVLITEFGKSRFIKKTA